MASTRFEEALRLFDFDSKLSEIMKEFFSDRESLMIIPAPAALALVSPRGKEEHPGEDHRHLGLGTGP